MPDLFRHPLCGTLHGMREREPCVYILASGFNARLYTGVTSNLIEWDNPRWDDLAVALGLDPLP